MRKLRIPATFQQILSETLRVMRDPCSALWALYVFLFPVYVIRSGLPQPGDLLIFCLVPVAFISTRGRVPRSSMPALRIVFLFTGYVIVENLAWSLILNSWTINFKYGFLLSPTFYVYNVLILLVVLMLYQRDGARFLWLTVRLIAMSALVQVVVSFFYHANDRGSRASVMFNSPNQLGYYGLISACFILIGQRRLGVSSFLATAGVMGCAYLVLQSASKAALGGMAMLLVAGLFNRARTMLVGAAVCGVLLLVADPLVKAVQRSQDRLENDTHMGFFEERGYDRIANHPEYWLLGAGEGAYRRFEDTTAIGDHEIHSSIGTLFHCYGIVGSGLFGLFLWRALRGSGLRNVMLFMPAFAYGMTHQGLRFTLLWVMIAMLIALRDLEKQRRTATRAPRAAVAPALARPPAAIVLPKTLSGAEERRREFARSAPAAPTSPEPSEAT